MVRAGRRRQFATPFVIVAGCWGDKGTPQPVMNPPPPGDAARVAHLDAAIHVDAPLDAPQVAVSVDAAPRTPGKCDLDPTASGCNPPAPAIHEATFNAHVVTYIGAQNGGLEFEVQVHTREFATMKLRKLRGVFVDSKSQPIAGGDFKVVSRTKDRARCRWPGSATSLPSQRVKLLGEYRDGE